MPLQRFHDSCGHISLECCKSILFSGGNVSASGTLEDRNGEYVYQSSKTTNKAFYVLLGGSTNSSIAFGDDGKGWRVCL